MKPFAVTIAGLALLTACATRVPVAAGLSGTHKTEIISHSFEKRLYVANRRVPFLSQSEWAEISAQLGARKNYVFDSATRQTGDLVTVRLVENHTSTCHLELYFEKKNGRWIEDRSKSEETVEVRE